MTRLLVVEHTAAPPYRDVVVMPLKVAASSAFNTLDFGRLTHHVTECVSNSVDVSGSVSLMHY